MGMFDDITYRAPCPICGTALTSWQSKDGSCCLLKLTPAELWVNGQSEREYRQGSSLAAHDGYTKFYKGCGKCGTWIEIRISSGFVEYTPEECRRIGAGDVVERKRGPILRKT